jgi:hypothetical protein
LGIIGAALGFAGADELVGLEDDFPDAALAYSGVLAAGGVDPVHHHAGHGLHPIGSLPSGFTLN